MLQPPRLPDSVCPPFFRLLQAGSFPCGGGHCRSILRSWVILFPHTWSGRSGGRGVCRQRRALALCLSPGAGAPLTVPRGFLEALISAACIWDISRPFRPGGCPACAQPVLGSVFSRSVGPSADPGGLSPHSSLLSGTLTPVLQHASHLEAQSLFSLFACAPLCSGVWQVPLAGIQSVARGYSPSLRVGRGRICVHSSPRYSTVARMQVWLCFLCFW